MNQLTVEEIEGKMHELEKILGYTFQDVSLLSSAMKSQLLEKREDDGKYHKEYSNEALAFLGDTVIKFLIAEHLYKDECKHEKRKGDMTNTKKVLESNAVFHKLAEKEGIIRYAYNEKTFSKPTLPDHERVCSKKHDPYIEAITAAIYLDRGWDDVTKWFQRWLLPKLKERAKA